VSKFARDNHVFFEFHVDHCLVKHQETEQTLLHGKVKDGLYVFQDFIPTNKLSVNTSSVAPNIDLYTLWHKRFGHANSNVIHRIMKQCNLHIPAKQQFCDTCAISKAYQLPFTDSATVYTSPLELVFIDIWGPSPVPSSSCARYYIAFLDAYTRYVWLYLIQNKSQAITVFKSFKLYSEKKIGFPIKSIQTDNTKEFLVFRSFLDEHGIQHRLTCPHTHEQNGSIERKHRHITEMGLSLLAGANLPLTFWGEAFSTVVTIINVLPTMVLKYDNSYQLWFHKEPNYKFFKTFGYACYPLLRPYNSKKFDFKSSLCIFLGYKTKATNA